MNPTTLENFLFVPDPQRPSGTLYELSPSRNFEPNSFVLLPYSNPQIKKTEPKFYTVKTKTHVADLAAFTNASSHQTLSLKATVSKQQYFERVQALKQHIQIGNIYEINYCIRFFAEEVIIDPLDVFCALHLLAKAPYAALVKLDQEYLISASPELFLKKEGTYFSTKPIKGTIRRGENPEEDEALKTILYKSQKDRTENVMAVDVARNDLSQFAKKATVQVNKLFNIETFETVHQMVSTVSCEAKEGTSFEKIIDSMFPMASMTGAPKLMAMKLIGEYEHVERGYYSGAMGLVDHNGNFTWSVIIRTIFYDQRTKKITLAVGSAITALSDPEQEYEECLLKAAALLKALNATIE